MFVEVWANCNNEFEFAGYKKQFLCVLRLPKALKLNVMTYKMRKKREMMICEKKRRWFSGGLKSIINWW